MGVGTDWNMSAIALSFERSTLAESARLSTVCSYSQKCLEPSDLSRELRGWQCHFTSLDRALVRRKCLSDAGLNRGDPRLTFPNQPGGPGLLWLALPQPMSFTEDKFLQL